MNSDKYIGQKYNKLTILRIVSKDKYYINTVEVQCDCEKGTIFTVRLPSLKNNICTSCGCDRKSINKKYNTYDLTGGYGIGYDCNNKEFYFDLEDYDKIKDICWNINYRNRTLGNLNNKTIQMSKFLTNTKASEIVDHINLNPRDNRRENLRIVTQSQNLMNTKGHGKMSKFGLKGISWDKNSRKWLGLFIKDGKKIFYKKDEDISTLINLKIEAEKEHFGDYRYAWENGIKWDELLEYEKEIKLLIRK